MRSYKLVRLIASYPYTEQKSVGSCDSAVDIASPSPVPSLQCHIHQAQTFEWEVRFLKEERRSAIHYFFHARYLLTRSLAALVPKSMSVLRDRGSG